MSNYVTDNDANDMIILIKDMLDKGKSSLEIADHFNSNNIEFYENNGVWTKKDVDKIISDHQLDIKKSSSVWSILNWILGILFLISGLTLLPTSLIGGLLFIGVSLLVLPPVRNFIFSKTSVSIPTPVRVIASIVFFLVGSGYITDSKLQEFNKNKDIIVTDIQTKFDDGKYEEALSLTQQYEYTNNTEILSLQKQAKKIVDENRKDTEEKRKAEEEKLAKQKKEESLLEEIKNTDSNDTDKKDNIRLSEIYSELQSLSPENEKYTEKHKEYLSKAKEDKEKIKKLKEIEEKASKEKKDKEIEITLNKEKNKYIERLKRELEGIPNVKVETYTKSKETIKFGVVLLNLWAVLAEEGNKFDSFSKSEQKLLKRFKTKVSSAQVKIFPKLRDAYGPIVRKELWEHDISAKTFGKGYRTIDFVGGLFAANKNIKQVHQSLIYMLREMRFRKTQYKWYKGDSEFTYFNIESPKDSELVIWEDDGTYKVIK